MYKFYEKNKYKSEKALDNVLWVVYNITVIWFGHIVWPLMRE